MAIQPPYYIQAKHPAILPTLYESHWQIMKMETHLINETWVNCHKQKKTCMTGKNRLSSLVVSEVHSSRLAMQ